MNDVVLSARLLSLRDGAKQLLGDLWDERVAQYEGQLRSRMTQMSTDNALSAAVSIAKEMAARREDPGMLIAVAVDLCERHETARNHRINDEIDRRRLKRHFGEEF